MNPFSVDLGIGRRGLPFATSSILDSLFVPQALCDQGPSPWNCGATYYREMIYRKHHLENSLKISLFSKPKATKGIFVPLTMLYWLP